MPKKKTARFYSKKAKPKTKKKTTKSSGRGRSFQTTDIFPSVRTTVPFLHATDRPAFFPAAADQMEKPDI